MVSEAGLKDLSLAGRLSPNNQERTGETLPRHLFLTHAPGKMDVVFSYLSQAGPLSAGMLHGRRGLG